MSLPTWWFSEKLLNWKNAGICRQAALEDLQFSIAALNVSRHLEVDLIKTDESRRQPGEQNGGRLAVDRNRGRSVDGGERRRRSLRARADRRIGEPHPRQIRDQIF